MSSGYGYTGGRSRCFAFWQDFQKCHVQADLPGQCENQKEDYMECLHHTKEIARGLQIKSEYLSRTAKELQSKRQEAELVADSGVLGLGLLTAESSPASSSS